MKTLVRRTKTSAVPKDPTLYESVEKLIVKEAQSEMYHEEIQAIRNGREPPKNSPLLPLNPILDSDGLLWVGGRIHRRQTQSEDNHSVHPIIVPKGSPHCSPSDTSLPLCDTSPRQADDRRCH